MKTTKPIRSKEELKKHIELKAVSKKAEDLLAELMNMSNVLGQDHARAMVLGMTTALTNQHRAIQQEFITTLRETLEWYGKAQTDARNESAVKWAKEAAEIRANYS